MGRESLAQMCGPTDINLVRHVDRLDNVNVRHAEPSVAKAMEGNLRTARAKSAKESVAILRAEAWPATVAPLAERRLEARGVEPLSLRPSSQTSTCVADLSRERVQRTGAPSLALVPTK